MENGGLFKFKRGAEKQETQEDFLKRMNSYKSIKSTYKKKKTLQSQDSMVFLGHAHWDLVVYMMTGLQMATKSLVSPSYFDLHPRDFKIKYYFEILPRYQLPSFFSGISFD